MSERTIVRTVSAVATSDGAGVRLSRAIANAELDHLDPFLLLDEFRSDDPSDYIAGFPDHPHRGFETVTYMLSGRMEHADHAGNRGLLVGGGAQWMTAGRGIIHSETPKQEDGLMWGFQLWVNLPAKSKMTAPRYQDIDPSAIPEVKIDGGSVRVIAGTFQDATGPVQGIVTDPVYLDVRLGANGRFETAIPEEHTAFVYAYQGRGAVGATPLSPKTLGVLSTGGTIAARAADSDFRFLCIAARPLNEPIARYGPFVMNTREEIQQAFEDFPERPARVSEIPAGQPPRREGRGSGWAIAMVFLTLACLVLPILLIRSAMTRVRSLGGAAESALIAVRHLADGFRTGEVETTLRSYGAEVHGTSRFQFAELRQLESFERKDSTSIAWGAIPLPDVVVEARGSVVYTYNLDLQKRWDLKLTDHTIDVVAPTPEFGTPALDPSTLTFETRQGSVLRDEEAVRKALQTGLAGLLNERARAHLPLVRETGRKATEDFVRNFLLSRYDDAAGMTVRVRFADEAATLKAPPPLVIEGGRGPASTPRP